MKSLIPWQRAPKAELHHRLDRLFDQFLTDPWGRSWVSEFVGNGQGERAFLPSVEIKETETQVIVRAELPGVDAKDVQVELVDNVLALSGSRLQERSEKEDESTVSEFRFGSFRREIALPADVEPEKVKASCEKGILTVEMQKSRVSRTRRIAVEAR